MEKFIKLNVNGTGTDSGYKLIPINNIMEVKQESVTEIQIFYQHIASASIATVPALVDAVTQATYDITQQSMVQSLKITLAADAYDGFSWKDFLNQSIETAYTLSWQQPVFTPNPSSYPKAAAAGYAPTIISSIVTGVKIATPQVNA